jgi:hypothetical protein
VTSGNTSPGHTGPTKSLSEQFYDIVLGNRRPGGQFDLPLFKDIEMLYRIALFVEHSPRVVRLFIGQVAYPVDGVVPEFLENMTCLKEHCSSPFLKKIAV